MNVKTLYNKDEEISLESYLNKHNISDTQEFLYPSGKYLENPLWYNNMGKGVNIILDSLSKNEQFGLLVDIDGDGWYSSSLFYKYIKLVKPDVKIKVFFHHNKIHGLSEEGLIESIINSNIQIMIIPDASSGEEYLHKILFDNKIKCVIADHHSCDIHSKYACVINNQQSPSVLNKSGSGTLVTFKLLKEIDNVLELRYTKDLIDIVWFSLLSDIMNMNTMENACFSYWAKKNIKNKCLIALIDKLAKDRPLNNETISWNIQPKVSAIIRCRNQELKETLFWALAEEKEEYINIILDECQKVHNQQKKEVEEYYENCSFVDSDDKIIFNPVDIYPFYTGLVASKYVSDYNLPVILYTEHNDYYTGSIRSPIPIKQTLKDSGLFTFVEGHDASAGCGFTKENFNKIKQFCKEVEVDDSIEVTQSFITSEIPNDLFGLTSEYKDIWGKGIEKPLFHIHSIHINGKDIKELGNGSTIKFSYKDVDFIKFFCSKDLKEQLHIGKNKKLSIEVIGELDKNEFRGKITNQVIIDKIEIKDYNRNINDVF